MKKSGLKNAAVFAAFILAFVCSSGALALDATSFDPRNVSVEADSISGVPVGTIITWPVATNPEGWDEGKWLECNGQTISQTVYPELFALVGATVPDMRGLFLRGYGSHSHSQNNGTQVGITSTLHSSGPLGAIQGDAARPLTGYLDVVNESVGSSGIIYGTPDPRGVGVSGDHGRALGIDTIEIDSARGTPTAEENRPVNRAVRYLIRAQP